MPGATASDLRIESAARASSGFAVFEDDALDAAGASFSETGPGSSARSSASVSRKERDGGRRRASLMPGMELKGLASAKLGFFSKFGGKGCSRNMSAFSYQSIPKRLLFW